MIAAAAAATSTKFLDERHQRRSTTVRLLFSYCCQTLKAFMQNDSRISFSRKYKWIFAERKFLNF
jgi:hypothetical protein